MSAVAGRMWGCAGMPVASFPCFPRFSPFTPPFPPSAPPPPSLPRLPFTRLPTTTFPYSPAPSQQQQQQQQQILPRQEEEHAPVAATDSADSAGLDDDGSDLTMITLADADAYKPYSKPPRRWRGRCEKRADFSACNRKVIGARFFSKGFKRNVGAISSSADYLSARDADGHGTWCAGAAAGNGHVQYAAGTGYSYGNTSGMAPRARLAIYKVLWKQRDGQTLATYSDIRAAVDAAVSDGVDVLSISLGGNVPSYFSDIAYLNAAKAGVFIAMAAGNSGRPNPKKLVGTIGNASPFYLTVGASHCLPLSASPPNPFHFFPFHISLPHPGFPSAP
ncbi:unnamed protein product [Closterium sp. Naga37s-1]|nr:unnamed protein product [Closterium sp. Naga37s-1]